MPLQVSTPEGQAVRTASTQTGSTPLDGMTVSQVDAWINANVTDLASAKTALRIIGKLLFLIFAQLRQIQAELKQIKESK